MNLQPLLDFFDEIRPDLDLYPAAWLRDTGISYHRMFPEDADEVYFELPPELLAALKHEFTHRVPTGADRRGFVHATDQAYVENEVIAYARRSKLALLQD